MPDKIPTEQRHYNMSQVRNKNTEPEMMLRSLLHRMGYRFRLYRKDLPGSPDIVLPKFKTVIFVHGCFWHRHPGCKRASTPVDNHDFWQSKFAANMQRDQQAQEQLCALGWKVIVVWQCEIGKRKLPTLSDKLKLLIG